MDTDEPFRLAADPATPRARLERAIRDRHAERDRVAQKDPTYAEARDRSFIAMAGETLLGVFDPTEDGATLDGVIAGLSAGFRGEFVVTRGGRILAVVRRARDGRQIVTTF
jgi:hypothetical protein